MYAKLLGKRLLFDTSKNYELEKRFIQNFKSETGDEFMSKIEQMFGDVEASQELTKSFTVDKKYKAVDFSVQVLETKSWPVEVKSNTDESSLNHSQRESGKSSKKKETSYVFLPSPMNEIFSSFADNYKKQFKGRSLTFIYEYGSFVVVGYLKRG